MNPHPITTAHVGRIAFQGSKSEIRDMIRALLGADHARASREAAEMIEAKLEGEMKR